ncbi:MAG TPA: nucleotidyltransferase substrate binding protein [Prolixibacteraceae bacterium]|nr:nucleotidyltransferase substrate binding protein [Prolixibacteraceae bacterium]HPR61909.1 nucleotidyltransferase substrate binding protein [Prolixibacteraceae bacterium]
MENTDIRWRQRFNSFLKAFSQLKDAVVLSSERVLSGLEEQGMIQAFEYTHELAWKMTKDFLQEKGNNDLYGSKDTTRLAFKLGIIENGEVWMDMIKSRNLTSHTYNEDTAKNIVADIKNRYFPEFENIKMKFEAL